MSTRSHWRSKPRQRQQAMRMTFKAASRMTGSAFVPTLSLTISKA